MGFTLPSPTSPAEQVRTLTNKRTALEADLEGQFSILKANNCTMRTPLVDGEGFPRADIDIFAVRHARVRVIELRNDLDALTVEIGKALEGLYDPSLRDTDVKMSPADSSSTANVEAGVPKEPSEPFARVNGVAPGSPSADAGLKREDVVIHFGSLTSKSFSNRSDLKPLAELVNANENRSLTLKVIRSGQPLTLTLIPKKWDGRGLLGCHIVPHS